MSTKTKIWLAILATPIVLLAVGIIVLTSVYNSEKLKSIIVPRVEEATHRTVDIQAISLAFFPSLGVDVRGFSLSNRKGEDFSSEPFLSFDRLRVSVKLLPLLKKVVEVEAVEIERPHILIETNRLGETNYSDLQEQRPASAPGHSQAEVQSKTSGSLLVSRFVVGDASVDYLSYKDNSATRIRGMSATLQADGIDGAIKVGGEAGIENVSYGSIDTPLLEGLKLTLIAQLDVDLPGDLLTIRRGDLTVQDMRLNVMGTVHHLTAARTLDIHIGADNLNITDLLSLVPKEYMKKAEGLKGNGIARVAMDITGTMADSTVPDVSGHISTRGASVQYPKLPKPIANIVILSEFTRSAKRQEFRIDTLTAMFGDNPLRMSMVVTNFDDPFLTMSAGGALNLAEVHEFYPLEQGTEVGGMMTLDVRMNGKVKNPTAMKAAGTMEFKNVTAKTASTKKPVQNLNGTMMFNNQSIESKNLSMVIGTSDLALAFSLKNYLSMMSSDKGGAHATASVSLRSNRMFTADIMSEEQPAQPGAGGTQMQKSPGQQTVTVPANAKKTSLPLPNVDMDVTGSIGTLTMQRFEFTNVRAALRIAHGVITMQNFSLNAFGGSIVSKGTLHMENPQRPLFDLALDMNGLESGAMLSKFSSFGERINGTMSMTTSLKGALDDTLGLVRNALSGNGRVQIQNGNLRGFKVNQVIASAVKLPDLENIAFKDWANTFTIQDGRVQIKDLKISALNAEYIVNGSQGLDGSLDYATTLLLPASTSSRVSISGFAGDAVNAFKDQNGRLKIDFTIGGTTDDPKVQLNTEAARKHIEEMAMQKVQDEAKKLGDQVKQKAGDALKNLFKGKK